MRMAICTFGGDFNDHSNEVMFVNSYMLNSAHQQTHFNVCVQELKAEWKARRYVWYRWVVIDDFDGADAPIVINFGGEAHPIKEKIKLNQKAEQAAKLAKENPFYLEGTPVRRKPITTKFIDPEILAQMANKLQQHAPVAQEQEPQ